MLAGLRAMELLAADARVEGEPLAGGVSSDIWRTDLPGHGAVCVKRALPTLKVAAAWHVSPARNLFEARWMRRAARVVPDAVPEFLGQDPATFTLAMRYLPPDLYPLWKARLRDGQADPAFATELAASLVRIHAATAAEPALAAEFDTGAIFHELRLDPYLLATARVHPDLAGPLEALVETTAATRLALVHGDVSPKNILCGPRGPVFLDAECAWWGDPAFDLAFCLNHLLLKCLWTPAATDGFLACFDALAARYLAGVDWEAPAGLAARAAHLLPGLLLARVDGKSPVEYITEPEARNRVRRVARRLLLAPARHPGAIREAWREELDR